MGYFLMMKKYLYGSITLLLRVWKKMVDTQAEDDGTPLAVAAIYKQIEMTLERFQMRGKISGRCLLADLQLHGIKQQAYHGGKIQRLSIDKNLKN